MNSAKWRERQHAHVDKLEQDIWNQEATLRDLIAFGTDLVGRGLKMRPGPRKDELDMRTAEIDEKIAKLERQLDETRKKLNEARNRLQVT
jgi:hypothetical protein